MYKVCAFSDGHGYLPEISEPFDILLIAGDNIPLGKQSIIIETLLWYTDNFVKWINKLPFKDKKSKVYVIAGNHEVAMSKLSVDELNELWDYISEKTKDRVIYLQNQLAIHDENIKIFGTPYCKVFGRWAYMARPETLKAYYSAIPEDTDILLTHDAPYGTSDICFDHFYKEHLGNVPLKEAIEEKQPKYCIHGHLHTANHEVEKLGDTSVICVSLLDEEYYPTFEPFYFEI
jgi:Icc-related predicted phosphoesterase